MTYKVGQKRIRTYQYDGVIYTAEITYKRMRNTVIRYGKEPNSIRVSVPNVATLEYIDKVVFKLLPKLLKHRPKPEIHPTSGEKGIYLFGERMEFEFENEAEKEAFLKRKAISTITKRVRYYEPIMGVTPPYKVSVRKMSTRYGSNSKRTHSLHFTIDLIHYPIEVIDSVVVHELAHHFVFDHSQKFYNVVYRYCPDYWKMHERLRKRQYERETH